MPKPLNQDKTYTTFQIAAIRGVQPNTIIQWIKKNKLPVRLLLAEKTVL